MTFTEYLEGIVSVEPPPKQGCEVAILGVISFISCLSGTPAEAGVRVDPHGFPARYFHVSVEPPPKQGCEITKTIHTMKVAPSQWNPRRSRGARPRRHPIHQSFVVSVEPPPKQGCEIAANESKSPAPLSQWNPRRSRGASPHVGRCGLPVGGLSGTPAEAGVRGDT